MENLVGICGFSVVFFIMMNEWELKNEEYIFFKKWMVEIWCLVDFDFEVNGLEVNILLYVFSVCFLGVLIE